ncbi:MAG: DUF1428 domain-containing protein [Planctomycetes bacterium]|nr:DUF1428 domain-containing protein [Planctomycetota bacterium]
MAYADCFVLPVPKKNLAKYKKMARAAAKIWGEHGAIEYRECVSEDLKAAKAMGCVGFDKLSKAKPGDAVVVAWIVYKNRGHRDKVNASVMKDPRLSKMCDPANMPFNPKAMAYGGFSVMVEG